MLYYLVVCVIVEEFVIGIVWEWYCYMMLGKFWNKKSGNLWRIGKGFIIDGWEVGDNGYGFVRCYI